MYQHTLFDNYPKLFIIINIMLKIISSSFSTLKYFYTIQDDIDLKQMKLGIYLPPGFNTIQDDIDLKRIWCICNIGCCFNTIQDDIDLKLVL